MKVVEDAVGMLRVALHPGSRSSGSGNNYAVALVVAEHAERAAFARTALAVKLRELDVVCDERDRLDLQADRLIEECRDLAIHCERHDADLEAAISGRLRRAR